MQIDPKKCVGCGNCVPICPMGAIHVDPSSGRASVDFDECVECYACFRGMSMENLNPRLVRSVRRVLRLLRIRFDPEPDVCPTSAIVPNELSWPRIVRRAFSDVQVSHESTGIHGRGTEEVKTNDVTHRVGRGEAGFTVEFGRPSVGVRFREVERVTKSLARHGVSFEKKNPVTSLMADVSAGALKPELLDEKVLSAIVEFKTTLEKVPGLLDMLSRHSEELETVMSLGVSSRCDETGEDPLERILKDNGYGFLRAKTNLGLGHS